MYAPYGADLHASAVEPRFLEHKVGCCRTSLGRGHSYAVSPRRAPCRGGGHQVFVGCDPFIAATRVATISNCNRSFSIV